MSVDLVGLLYWSARLVGFGALALLIGTAFFVAAWWPGGGRHPAIRRLLWLAWVLLVATTVATLLLFGPVVTGQPLRSALDPGMLATTLDTRMGTATLLRVLVLSVAAPGLALLLSRPLPRTPRQRGARVGGVLAGAAALAGTWSIAGHSAVGRHTSLAVAADVAHLIAMGVWLGGLVVLFAVLLPGSTEGTVLPGSTEGTVLPGSTEGTGLRHVVPAFSRAALVCVAVLVGTGAYQGWRQVGSPAALVTTSYGWLLLGKLALVALLVGLGAASRSWVRRYVTVSELRASARRTRTRRGPGHQELVRFRAMVAVEAAVAVVVLGVTASLVASQPARAAAGQAGQDRPVSVEAAERSDQPPAAAMARLGFDAGPPTGAGVVDVALVPATVGHNELHLSVLDNVGSPLDVPVVTATLSLPDRTDGRPHVVPLRKIGPGHYISLMTISLAGRWQLVVTVGTSQVDQTTVVTQIDVR